MENAWDEVAIDGWGMIWLEGKRRDHLWPDRIPRIGVPEGERYVRF